MHYNIVALALVLLGFALLFFVDYLVAKDTDSTFMKYLRDNNMVVGVLCLGVGYYVYTLGEKSHAASPVPEMVLPSENSDLPTYDEAMSTDEVLNM